MSTNEPAPRDRASVSEIEHILPPAGLTTPPLSFAARVGHLLFVSGLPGYDDAGVLSPEFDVQFDRSVARLRDVLAQGGCGVADIVKVNVLLTRRADVAAMNASYAAAFGPAPYPARTTCVVESLPYPAMLIEIECVARVP